MEARLLPSPSKRRRTNLAPSEPQRTSQQTQLHTTSLLPQKRSQPAPAKPAPSRKITLEHPPPPPPDHEQAAAQLRSRISTEEAEIAALTRQLEKENRRIALISVERRREDEAQDLM